MLAEVRKTADAVETIKFTLRKYQNLLNETKKTNQIAEETLSNVLLAIRQKEFLHAWYPQQGGYLEMNVVGQHPLKTERKNND